MGIFYQRSIMWASKLRLDIAIVNSAIFIGPAIKPGFGCGSLRKFTINASAIWIFIDSSVSCHRVSENNIRQFQQARIGYQVQRVSGAQFSLELRVGKDFLYASVVFYLLYPPPDFSHTGCKYGF